jgi:hypothetical protein
MGLFEADVCSGLFSSERYSAESGTTYKGLLSLLRLCVTWPTPFMQQLDHSESHFAFESRDQ